MYSAAPVGEIDKNRSGEMYSPTLAGEVDKIEQISGNVLTNTCW